MTNMYIIMLRSNKGIWSNDRQWITAGKGTPAIFPTMEMAGAEMDRANLDPELCAISMVGKLEFNPDA